MRLAAVLLVTWLGMTRVWAGEAAALDAIRHDAQPCDAARVYCFELHLHVAAAPTSADGDLVVTPAWLATQVATANRHFARLDVAFQVARVASLPSSAAHLRTRTDRNALATHVSGRVIHVFLTGQLDDVDIAGAVAYGVTWRKGARKYIIVSAQARERTLAHELGHFFGLPHSTYPISIMNKTERAEPPPEQRTFADEEYVKMGPVLRRLVRTRVIDNVKR